MSSTNSVFCSSSELVLAKTSPPKEKRSSATIREKSIPDTAVISPSKGKNVESEKAIEDSIAAVTDAGQPSLSVPGAASEVNPLTSIYSSAPDFAFANHVSFIDSTPWMDSL